MRALVALLLLAVLGVGLVAQDAGASAAVAQPASTGTATGAAGATTGTAATTWTGRVADSDGAAGLAHGGAGVTVAVLDTWVDQGHPAFGGRVLAGADCALGPCVPLLGASAAPDGCEPHGTHVAGIIGSAGLGIAPASTLLPVRVLATSNGQCVASPTAVASGIRYATAAGARVINVSLDGGAAAPAVADRGIAAAVAAAAAAGDLVVFAAGNSGHTTVAVSYPDAVSVGAAGPDGSLASYSEIGAALLAPGGDAFVHGAPDCSGDAFAPSDCVESTWFCQPSQPACSPHGLAFEEGTSMAAPVVSGLAALLFAQSPDRGLADVRAVLLDTARPRAGSLDGLVDGCQALLQEAPPDTRCHGQRALAVTTTVRVFSGCARSVVVRRGSRPVLRCRVWPARGGLPVAVQVQRGRSWVTVTRLRTGPDGSLRALGPRVRRSGRIRLSLGRTTTVIAVATRP